MVDELFSGATKTSGACLSLFDLYISNPKNYCVKVIFRENQVVGSKYPLREAFPIGTSELCFACIDYRRKRWN